MCTVFKPKAYKLYLPTVFIGSDALKFIKESKYLGFTFSDSKSDDCDMLRQMRLLYAKSNKLLRHLVIVLRMSRLPYFKVIAQHCIVRICGMITKNQHLAKFVLHSIMLTEKYLVYLSGVVPVRCMQTTISVTLKQL